uniref:Uncharacterized protein n=1 Tax=Onchocerca volvulus TaxID=6282 RepID=A0A8R1TRQ2_ONCVO
MKEGCASSPLTWITFPFPIITDDRILNCKRSIIPPKSICPFLISNVNDPVYMNSPTTDFRTHSIPFAKTR